MANQTFSSISDGTNTFDVKDLNALPLSGGTMTGNIVMGSNSITGLSTPTEETDAATKSYVDSKISDVTGEVGLVSLDDFNAFKTTVLPLSGGTMTGDINMGSTNGISNLAEPTEDSDAATKNYVDTTSLPVSGGTMTGPVNMSNQSIQNLAEPTDDSDAATKSYVDGRLRTYLVLQNGDTATQDAYAETIVGPCLILDLATKTTYYDNGEDGDTHERTPLVSGNDVATLKSEVANTIKTNAQDQSTDGEFITRADLAYSNGRPVLRIEMEDGWVDHLIFNTDGLIYYRCKTDGTEPTTVWTSNGS